MTSVWTVLDACLSVSAGSADIDRCRRTIRDPGLDWLAVAALANRHYVAPALWTTLSRFGLCDGLEAEARAYFSFLHAQNAARNQQLYQQCLAIGRTLAAAGMNAVLLKGATWLFDGSLAASTDRMMRDIDLLVAPETMAQAVAALVAAGYRDTSDSFVEVGHFHYAPLLPAEGVAGVELHRDLAHRSDLLRPEEILTTATPVAPGLLMPLPAHRIIHNVIHAQIENGDWVGGIANLRDVLDLARLVAAHHADTDWQRLRERAIKRRYFRSLSGALHTAHRLLGSPLPAAVSNDVAGRLHGWRCLQQRRWPWLLRASEGLAEVVRSMAWPRDAYGLGLTKRLSLQAQAKVAGRRMRRAVAAFRRMRQNTAERK